MSSSTNTMPTASRWAMSARSLSLVLSSASFTQRRRVRGSTPAAEIPGWVTTIRYARCVDSRSAMKSGSRQMAQKICA
ncbi:hypothetical protein D7193_15155 [Micromonospora costi]|uniref:Uncharacterized protein n=1 Tax=Micromonospora costi TaxID=1530042 RepID=A0A3B0A691_9ACTN|nr:hypothetical protein D7193_15155 [Micromonospora costi]